MKKYKILVIGALIVVGLIAVSGIHIPFIVAHIHKQIKVGQNATEVTKIISGFKRQPDIATWRVEGTETRLHSERRQCNFPSDKIIFVGKTNKINLELCYVGPGFLKNDFYITFNSLGKVVFVSNIRKWD
jgi:hypothetical protein